MDFLNTAEPRIPAALTNPAPLHALIRSLAGLILLFSLELLVITVVFDNSALYGRGGLIGFAGMWGATILRGVVGFSALMAVLVWTKRNDIFRGSPVRLRLSLPYLGAHLLALALFGSLSTLLYGQSASGISPDLVAAGWLATGVGAIALGACAFLAPEVWRKMLAVTGNLWMVAGIAIVFACVVGNSSRAMWPVATRITFSIVETLLRWTAPPAIANPQRMQLGTERFSVEIAPECSGLEGVGLILAFGILALFVFRREYRFPRAFLLLPVGMLLIFLANSLRITGLILLGNAGAEKIALGGFHSQAGWMLFNVLAIGMVLVSRRIPWMLVPTEAGAVGATAPRVESSPAPWLLPFLAILAGGMVSQMITAQFEWTYPLRFFAAAAVLYVFRGHYRNFDWRIRWQSPATGIVVFLIWMALEPGAAANSTPKPAALASAIPAIQFVWLLIRVVAATITVPFAEELAFRGFLLRRIISPNFEAVKFPPARYNAHFWLAVAVSSVAFGLMHGERWFAGILAGLLYARSYFDRGRIVDAVVAHSVTNALIAVSVLGFHRWNLW